MFRIMNHAKLPLNMACSSASREHQSKKASSLHPDVDKQAESEHGLDFELLPPNVDVHYWERCRAKNIRTMESNPEQQKCAVRADT